jgi:hypothetical protein
MSGSLFFDLSNNANKLRKSYVNGFMDISGELLLRNDHSLGFYKEQLQKLPHYTMDSTGFKIYDITDVEGNFSTVSDVTTDNLKHLSGVDTNIATDIAGIKNILDTREDNIQDLVDRQNQLDLSFNNLPDPLNTSAGVAFASKMDVSGVATFDGDAKLNKDVEIKNGYINQVL